jgi:hypothetical protein
VFAVQAQTGFCDDRGDVVTEEEKFEEKFNDVRARLGVTGDNAAEVERVIYSELRRDPNEDAGVLAFRIKGLLSRGV